MDYIGVDEIPEREVIDFNRNQYVEQFEEYLISTNCCVLKGRNGISTQNVFTSVYIKGLTVVN